ncbi:MAG: hypothetical protein N3F65_03100 [Nitrososphaeria archaeon]|nr:hypothetical protein [Nitrososphaeria archaeon]
MSDNHEKDVYELLIELWRNELESEGLTKLPDGLVQKLKEYIGGIKHYLKVSDKEALSTEIREAAVKATSRLVRELFEFRLRKILRCALNNMQPENLIQFERRLYPGFLKLINEYRESVEEIAEAMAYQDWEQIRARHEVVSFLKDVDQIVGPDLEVYGPFKAGDVAALPEETARNLELAAVVRIIKILEPKV